VKRRYQEIFFYCEGACGHKAVKGRQQEKKNIVKMRVIRTQINPTTYCTYGSKIKKTQTFHYCNYDSKKKTSPP